MAMIEMTDVTVTRHEKFDQLLTKRFKLKITDINFTG